MPRKRKASETTTQEEVRVAAPKHRVRRAPSPPEQATLDGIKAKAKTTKDRILFILAKATTLVGVPTIKKRLVEEYGLTESKAFNTNVNKALAALSSEQRADFGKVGGSYHAGDASAAYIQHFQGKASAAADEANAQKYMDQGCIQCCHCGEWCPGDCEVGEDSIARGSKYKCFACDKVFWTWISDGYTTGHEVEYKYSILSWELGV
ncbi:hypothetical protein DYB28_015921 [Aphanomyces astaci]|uniref:Uncharacterized protein n=1 Tax=Aphanomyces astaci TaxID=112090 RepID=A0A9X8EDD4_APHAT|nr:hypothetical protein DYB28_015921 [Aphanomyces astaci]